VNLRTVERVYTIYEYSDQPRSGIANYEGKAHWFENIFDETSDEYSNDYWLTSLSASQLADAEEQFQIFWRWRQAFDRGEVDLSTHPALPEDVGRYNELKNRIQNAVNSKVTQRFKVSGIYSPLRLGRSVFS
jgi:hypothetical protein